MSYPTFSVPAGDVLPIFFDTFAAATGASITLTGLAVTDIKIYKDGSITQRASEAGYVLLDTDGIDFDLLTGIHGVSIDTGDNTDAGFYAVGAWFTVVISVVTIDAQTVSFVAAQFRLMAAESVAAKPKVDVDAWLGTAAPALVAGRIDASVGAMAASVLTAAAIAADAITDAKVAADVTIASVTGAVGSVVGLTASNLDTTVSSRATPAQVKTEAVAALATDTYAEPVQGAPAATTTLAAKINYLFKAWRNRNTQTATTYRLYADDALTVDQKATVSDDATTFDRTEIASGP